MRFRSIWLVVAPAIIAVAVVGLIVARHAGTTSGTAPDLSTPGVKACPSGPPDACDELIARALHVDARVLPSIAPTTSDLRYRKGFVLISRTANEAPTAVIEYEASPGDSELQTFHVTFRVKAPPVRDGRRVGTTTGHRSFRIVRTNLGTLALVFNDEHFGYVVGRGVGADLADTVTDFARAKQLVDAIRLSTRQLNPKVSK